MTDIYKIIYLDKDNIKNLIVFYGNNSKDDSKKLMELFNSDKENELFKGIFSSQEIILITNKNINVMFSDEMIYLDDTIETIKKKIIITFENNISYDEIYLFGKQIQNIEPELVYELLTQNNKIKITENILLQFLSNIENVNVESIPNKDIYNYNDIIDLDIYNKSVIVNIPLGHRSIIGDSIYSFSSNPFKLIKFDKLLSSNPDNIITTTNKEILLSSGFLFENTIYMCSAEDVFENSISKNISEILTSKIYFPFLGNKEIINLIELNKNKIKLRDENNSIINSNFNKQLDNIYMFHNIYNTKENELNYIEHGINKIEFLISQNTEYKLPLDIVFKLLQSTIKMPLIKFNPSNKQEKIYRLYCDKNAKNGSKIPYLSKSIIFKIIKTIGQSKRVSCYIEHDVNDKLNPIILEFDNLANIYISTEFKESKSIPEIENIIKTVCNPIIIIVKKYLESSGYKMNIFNNLYDKNIDIINIKYISYISIEKNINLNNILGCVSSLFNVIVGELDKGIIMRYKRVSNFNEMDSQEAFIVELLNRANEDENIVKLLMDNYQLSETNAQLKIADVVNNLQVIQTMNKNRKLKIKNSPGFLTKITKDKFKKNIMITMENINNIFYLSLIPIYIDSLIRITQYPESSNVTLKTIDTLCNTTEIDEFDLIEDIVAPSEKKISENEPVAIIDNNNIVFGATANKQQNKSINVMDFINEDDDDYDYDFDDSNDSEDELFGGNSNNRNDEEGSDNEDTDEKVYDESEGIDIDLDDESYNGSYEEVEGIDVELDDNETNIEPEDGRIDIELDHDETNKDETNLSSSTSNINKTPIVSKKKTKLKIINEKKLEKNITGMEIANPNYFFNKLEKKEPTLFLRESDGKYSNYSRACAWNKRRQPVILTDEEKDIIDKEHPNSYENAIKYGSDPNKQYWYICPRYWDLKNNTSLTKEEVDSEKYGGIIPNDATNVPEGKNIWEFNDPKEHIDKNGNYIQHHPGFLKSDKHPDGLCIPCCFKKWDTSVQIKRRNECKQQMNEKDIINNKTDKTDKTYKTDKTDKTDKTNDVNNDNIDNKDEVSKENVDDYIKGPDKFPLEQDRYGYLPFIIQTFIGTYNKKCQISITNKNLKKKHNCFLRKGIEGDKNKSFIGCISDISSQGKTNSINYFINNVLLKMLTPDVFIYLQNGSLVTEFESKNLEGVELENIKDSEIFKKLKDINNRQLQKISSAYNNFIDYLKSPISFIDYTYLWDLICQPNELLFKNGVNMVILNIPMDDITSNINVVCPTNFYSSNKYDDKRDTIILVNKYEYFEPIYIVRDQGKINATSLVLVKLFTPELMNKVPHLKHFYSTINEIYNNKCKPLPSLPQKYKYKEIKFKKNITLEKSIEILNKYDINIVNLVINFDNKVIGLNVNIDDLIGYIPCFPSGIISSYDLVSIDNDENNKLLEETIEFLSLINNKTNNEILCKPLVKVLEDELVIGLLTETNQLIPLKEPTQDTDTSIKYTISDDNYIEVNKITQLSKNIDKQRVEYVKKIKLESTLYNEFRNTLRTLLNSYTNKDKRDEIEKVANSKSMLYYLQLEQLVLLIKSIMDNNVNFIPNNTKNIDIIEENLNNYERDILLIPRDNLLSNLNNETIYYSKLSDELIRYVRIKQFMFKPKMFLSFSDLQYNLHDNEIILLQSLLTQDYFDNLIPDNKTKYISYNSYDNSEPNISVPYDNTYNIISKSNNPNNENSIDKINSNKELIIYNNCTYSIKNIYAKLTLNFRGGYKEIHFSSETTRCTFDIGLTLINNYTDKQIDVLGIKNVLIKKYKELFNDFPNEIVNLFNYYGYILSSKQLSKGNITIDTIIINNDYYLTNFDLLLISNEFNIPITLIAPNEFKENNEEYLSLNINKGETFIIRTIGIHKYKHIIPKYKLIINKGDESLIKIINLPEKKFQDKIFSQNNNLMDLLKSYKTIDKTDKTIIKKKTNKLNTKLILNE